MHISCLNMTWQSRLFDIKAAKDTIKKYLETFCKAMLKSDKQKVISKPKNEVVDQSALIWLRQQRAAVVEVHGIGLKDAAMKFAEHHGASDFKEGWLFQLKQQHVYSNRRAHGETLDLSEKESRSVVRS